jgi:aerobic-type carbon monoxide dehydrogenase small subunit (CoxS/CutS family)
MPVEKTKGISRREFLKDAGLVVGGATVGSMALLNACGGTTTVTNTTTVGAGATVTNSVTKTVTTTVSGAGSTSTVTVTAPAGQAANADVYTLNVNGVDYKVQLQPWWNMAYVLRDKLGLFGTKVGCEMGQCASCTILQDGTPVLACLTFAVESQGKKFTTIEGLSNGITLSKVQQKFYDNEAFQCGFCTPGIILASTALLTTNAKPTADDVRLALSGHICACQNFKKVIETVTGGV